MSFELKWEENGYYLRMWNTVTSDDMHGALDKIWGNANSDGMEYCIRDYLDVTKVDIGLSDEVVAKYVSTFEKMSTESANNQLKLVAFLSKNDDMDRLIEGYTVLMKQYNPTAIFKNFFCVEDARKWVASNLQH